MDEKYFVAKITYDLPDENSGKIKKIREEKLVKGFFRAGDTQKYKAIRDSLDRNTELVFLLSDPNKKLRKGAQMTMGEWCLKEGFKVYTLDTVENLLEYINSEKVSKYHSKRKSK